MSHEIKGTVYYVGPETMITERFSNRLLVIHTSRVYQEKVYDKYTAIEFANKQMERLEGIRKGQELVVKFDVESREHKGKWYTSARGYSVEIQVNPAANIPSASYAKKEEIASPPNYEEGELPF